MHEQSVQVRNAPTAERSLAVLRDVPATLRCGNRSYVEAGPSKAGPSISCLTRLASMSTLTGCPSSPSYVLKQHPPKQQPGLVTQAWVFSSTPCLDAPRPRLKRAPNVARGDHVAGRQFCHRPLSSFISCSLTPSGAFDTPQACMRGSKFKCEMHRGVPSMIHESSQYYATCRRSKASRLDRYTSPAHKTAPKALLPLNLPDKSSRTANRRD
jgi:hypothetical protein